MEAERADTVKGACTTGHSHPNEEAPGHCRTIDAVQCREEQESSEKEPKIISSSETTDSIATCSAGSSKLSQKESTPASLDTEYTRKAFALLGQNEMIPVCTSRYQMEEIQNSNTGSATQTQKNDSKKWRPLSQSEQKHQERMLLKLCQEYEEELNAMPRNVNVLREDIREQFHDLYYYFLDQMHATDDKIQHHGIEAMSFMESKVEEFTRLLQNLREDPSTEMCLEEPDEALLHMRQEFQCLRLEMVGSLPLQYRTWKRMRSIVQPALEPLSLDPKSVHPHLTLSKSLRAVKLNPSMSSVHKNSESSKTCLYVLASQGFQCGRHYWEVDVGDKTNWMIGVASSLLNEQVRICSTGCVLSKDLSPENGFWVLSKCPGEEYCGLRYTPIKFKLKKNPERFGIYVDMENDNICFYDAETMVQIFVFNSYFKGWGKIHPFFGPGWAIEDSDFEPLRVCVV